MNRFKKLILISLLIPKIASSNCQNHYKWAQEYTNGYKWFNTGLTACCSIASAWLWSADYLIPKTILTSFTIDSGLMVAVSSVIETKMIFMHDLIHETTHEGDQPKLRTLHSEIEIEMSFEEMCALIYQASRLDLLCEHWFYLVGYQGLKKMINNGSLMKRVNQKLRERRPRHLITESIEM